MNERYLFVKIRQSSIGENVEIREFCTINNSEIGDKCKISERVSIKKCRIMDGVEINANSYIENAEIAKNTQISPNCSIVGVYHDFSSLGANKEDLFKKIIIGEKVWIGSGSIILPGVEIGAYSIIAAGSVVTKNIPPRHIYLGSPLNFKLMPIIKWKNKKNKP